MQVSLFIFCIIFIVGSIVLKNRVYNLLSLVGVFLVAAILLLCIGLELLGLFIIFIYVGAICILFLFVIMFIEIPYLESKDTVVRGKYQYLLFLGLIILSMFRLLSFRLEKGSNLSDLLEYSFEGQEVLGAFTSSFQLGLLFYTEYSIGVIICGIILLVAMICAIIISTTL